MGSGVGNGAGSDREQEEHRFVLGKPWKKLLLLKDFELNP
jgi:hypothetical protein